MSAESSDIWPLLLSLTGLSGSDARREPKGEPVLSREEGGSLPRPAAPASAWVMKELLGGGGEEGCEEEWWREGGREERCEQGPPHPQATISHLGEVHVPSCDDAGCIRAVRDRSGTKLHATTLILIIIFIFIFVIIIILAHIVHTHVPCSHDPF